MQLLQSSCLATATSCFHSCISALRKAVLFMHAVLTSLHGLLWCMVRTSAACHTRSSRCRHAVADSAVQSVPGATAPSAQHHSILIHRLSSWQALLTAPLLVHVLHGRLAHHPCPPHAGSTQRGARCCGCTHLSWCCTWCGRSQRWQSGERWQAGARALQEVHVYGLGVHGVSSCVSMRYTTGPMPHQHSAGWHTCTHTDHATCSSPAEQSTAPHKPCRNTSRSCTPPIFPTSLMRLRTWVAAGCCRRSCCVSSLATCRHMAGGRSRLSGAAGCWPWHWGLAALLWP